MYQGAMSVHPHTFYDDVYRFNPEPWLPSTARSASPNTQPSMNHDIVPSAHELPSNPGPRNWCKNDVDPPMPRTSHSVPFNEYVDELVGTPRWQQDLDDHFADVFVESVLSQAKPPIDDMVAQTLQVIERPTRAQIRDLSRTMCTRWMRMQFRRKDTYVYARETVVLISRIADYLGRLSVHAQKDFLDGLDHFCIVELKLTWRWYATVAIRGVLPIARKNLFMRVMTAVAMISYLFHGGRLQHGAVLDGLGYIAMMSPWPDAVAVIYALLHRLGPSFASERAGWYFTQRLLAELFPLTVGRVHVDPLCQLVSAINTLVAEWHDRTRVTLYHASPGEDNQFHVCHSHT